MATNRIIYEYKDNSTGRIINNDSIVADDSDGIIEHLGGTAFRYVPKESLSKEPVAADYGYDAKAMPQVPGKADTSPYNQTTPGTGTKYAGEFFNYTFGIDKIEIKETRPKECCGFLSKDINIGNCDYVELSVAMSGGNASMEFYIVEGIEETPILPVETSEVKNEKLFYGLSTRFQVDADKPVIIYKNGEETTISYSNIDKIEFGMDNYLIDYTPLGSPHQYFPNGTKIRVKAIQRYEKGKILPSTIDSIVILRHGGKSIWTM